MGFIGVSKSVTIDQPNKQQTTSDYRAISVANCKLTANANATATELSNINTQVTIKWGMVTYIFLYLVSKFQIVHTKIKQDQPMAFYAHTK